jgi:hypothetical protein
LPSQNLEKIQKIEEEDEELKEEDEKLRDDETASVY